MHADRIAIVADRIERAPEEQFDMNHWIRTGNHWSRALEEICTKQDIPEPGCGTAACIAGWTLFAFPKEAAAERDRLMEERFGSDPDDDDGIDISKIAAAVLGLDHPRSTSLFYGSWSNNSIQDITKEEAIGCLRHLATTGELP